MTILEKTLKAKLITHKPRFLKKATAFNVTLIDSFDGRYKSTISVFIPKLTPKYVQPAVFFHCKNGNGSVLIRCHSPLFLAEQLEQVITILRSNEFLDKWEHINDISQKLITTGEVVQNDKFIDAELFKFHIVNSI